MTFSSGEVLTAANLNALDINSLALSAGITFSGGANALDDYEQGSWSPTYNSSNSNMTGVVPNATFTFGRYVKVGNLVMATFFIRTDSISSLGTGSAIITGLPFDATNIATYNARVGPATCFFAFGSQTPDIVSIANNTATIYLRRHVGGGATDAQLTATELSTAANRNGLSATIVYQTD
jgi:hypothetical protein